MNDDLQVRGLIDSTTEWFDAATFADASDEQIAALADAFLARAARALSVDELDAAFQLQHRATCSRIALQHLLSGRLKVVGRRPTGEYVYSA